MSTKYGAVVRESYNQDSYDGRGYDTMYYDKLIEFDTKDALIEWIQQNNAGNSFSSKTVVKYLMFQELRKETTINVVLKEV